MAKRTGSPARGDRTPQLSSTKAGTRSGLAASPIEKKRAAPAEKAPARSKRRAKVVTAAPARAPAARDAATIKLGAAPLERGATRATPPPRIPTPPQLAPRSMELEWGGDPGGSSRPEESALDRWARRGDDLLLRLAEHGASDHEYRVDLREGRFYWVDAAGCVSAEARAEVLCTFVPQTSSVTMGWADAGAQRCSVACVPGMAAEVDGVDEEGAWRLAMTAADHVAPDYVYRARSPSSCVFLGLSRLTFTPGRPAFVPPPPVALVLSTLGEARVAADLGAEPVDTLRSRLCAAGATLLEQAEYAHRDTDWVARLVRTGRRLTALAERLPRPTFYSVAKGASTVWLDRDLADDLVASLTLLEEEWRQFA